MVFPHRDFHNFYSGAFSDWEMDLQFVLFLSVFRVPRLALLPFPHQRREAQAIRLRTTQ